MGVVLWRQSVLIPWHFRDAGAPITQDVAGVAMGLVTDGDEEIILTDILGVEDHYGEMDMKVKGTREGIAACQLYTKHPKGLSEQTLKEALSQARKAHEHILDHMQGQRAQCMPYHAPRVAEVQVERNGVRTLLRDRGAILRDIEERTVSKLWYDRRKQVVSVEAPNEEAEQLACKPVSEAVGVLKLGVKVDPNVEKARQSFAVV
ncbi:Polyribonucleotide nucleotidyltransferase [Gracilariopsis chorda]|uniref:Polyribonucleotide nucleotidyltransferase n=1 Tax=Gracilariopsis chorda TaxID=448386 RepID=A0A2V3IDK8_9FLOR|nr:Polyribonucleotide nucleotidyltransferase [Gracilariopsis chorda]|eukprot:PXF40147.1 Polyribonucleotide nucleotidyltransferase [Gracilariopsis chorda]